jgi:hypothetical protein
MNAKQIGLSFLLCDFLGLTAYAVYAHGYVGFFQLVMANVATATAFADLVIALSLVMVWMVRDARQRGVSSLPYVLLTLALGSVGPLAYLIRRMGSEQAHPVRAAVSAVH